MEIGKRVNIEKLVGEVGEVGVKDTPEPIEYELSFNDLRMLADAFVLKFPEVLMHRSKREVLASWREIAQQHRLRTLGEKRGARN